MKNIKNLKTNVKARNQPNKNEAAKTRMTTVYSRDQSAHGIDIPTIRIRGLWLRRAGFLSGEILEIRVEDGCLTIMKTNKEWKTEHVVRRTMTDIHPKTMAL